MFTVICLEFEVFCYFCKHHHFSQYKVVQNCPKLKGFVLWEAWTSSAKQKTNCPLDVDISVVQGEFWFSDSSAKEKVMGGVTKKMKINVNIQSPFHSVLASNCWVCWDNDLAGPACCYAKTLGMEMGRVELKCSIHVFFRTVWWFKLETLIKETVWNI